MTLDLANDASRRGGARSNQVCNASHVEGRKSTGPAVQHAAARVATAHYQADKRPAPGSEGGESE